MKVDVRLLVPGQHNRFGIMRDVMGAYYERLLVAGVRIFEYEKAMLHAKTMVVDGQWSAVGSFNMDPRSLIFNDEIAVTFCGSRVAREMVHAFGKDCEDAREVELEAWRRRGIARRCREAVFGLIQAYL